MFEVQVYANRVKCILEFIQVMSSVKLYRTIPVLEHTVKFL